MSWFVREVQLASMSTGTAVHELVGTLTAYHTGIAGLVGGSLDNCMRQHLVFDAFAHRQPVEFDKHWGDMVAASCSRYNTCTHILQSLHFVGY